MCLRLYANKIADNLAKSESSVILQGLKPFVPIYFAKSTSVDNDRNDHGTTGAMT